jgi:hypothetical protein
MIESIDSHILKIVYKVANENKGHALKYVFLKVFDTKYIFDLYGYLKVFDDELTRQENYIKKSGSNKTKILLSHIKEFRTMMGGTLSNPLSQIIPQDYENKIMTLDMVFTHTQNIAQNKLDDFDKLCEINTDNISDPIAQTLIDHISKEFKNAINIYHIKGTMAFVDAVQNNMCKINHILEDENIDHTTKSKLSEILSTSIDFVDSVARGKFLADGVGLFLS